MLGMNRNYFLLLLLFVLSVFWENSKEFIRKQDIKIQNIGVKSGLETTLGTRETYGGWGKKKLKLTTLPIILFIHVVCQLNSIVLAIQR